MIVCQGAMVGIRIQNSRLGVYGEYHMTHASDGEG